MICGLWGLNSLHSFRHLLLQRFITPKEVCNIAVFKPTCNSTLALLLLIYCHKHWRNGSQSRLSSFLQNFLLYPKPIFIFTEWTMKIWIFFIFFFVCEPPFSSSRMLAFCRFDRNIRKILTCRNRADYIYNYSCLRSHCRMFPPALLTFLKLPRM